MTGVSSGKGGLGDAFANRERLEIVNLLAGLPFVILLGLQVGNFVFVTMEKRTICRWGVQHQARQFLTAQEVTFE